MYVRDYAPVGKSPRDYSRGAATWPLAVRRNTVVPAGAPLRVELDLAVKIESAVVIVVLPRPDLILKHGLRPTLGAEMRSSSDPLSPLALWVETRGDEAVTLPAGAVIADILLCSAAGERLVPDADLDHEMFDPETGLRFDPDDGVRGDQNEFGPLATFE